jgi:hypothetical protein
MATKAAELYEEDFYAWTQQQAQALRMVTRELNDLYRRARQTAAVGALVHEPDLVRRLPKICPYDWDTIWHRNVLAEAGIDLGESDQPDRRRTGGPASGRRARALDARRDKNK